MTVRGDKPAGSLSLLRDFRLLLYLFVGFRLLLLIVYQPMIVNGTERGLSAGGDLSYYYGLGALSDQGLLPFRDYWSEFPPIWPALYATIYQLTKTGGEGNYSAFASVMGLIMVVFDTGNLILVSRIGGRLYGRDTGLALAWIYALLLAPMVFLWWTFEAMVAFTLLLAVWWLIGERDARSAVAAGVGGLIKFVPLIVLGAVWRFRTPRQALRYTAFALGLFVLIYCLIVATTGSMGAASLVAQFGKSSYSTVWALLDGNYTTGIFGAIEGRLDVANATRLTGNPPVIASWLRLAIFGGFGLYVYATVRRYDRRGLAAFVTLTLFIFFLWAQGWSPQWLALILPLTLVVFPNRTAVLALLLLSLIAFTEYPLLFIRTGDSGGVVTGALRVVFAGLVLARTAILIGLSAALVLLLRRPVEEGQGGET